MRLPIPKIHGKIQVSPNFHPDHQAIIDDVLSSASPHVINPLSVRDVGVGMMDEFDPAGKFTPQTRGFYDHDTGGGLGLLGLKKDLEPDQFRSTLAHELQHLEQFETRPEMFNDYIDASVDRKGYWFHPTEVEARAASWAEEKRTDNPLLWPREELARNMGSSPDWEMGPKMLGSDRRPGQPTFGWETLDAMIAELDGMEAQQNRLPEPTQRRLPFTQRERFKQGVESLGTRALRKIGL